MENNDHLLASANLAPNGMEPILEQYDNTPTRRWLEQFLTEHEISGGILRINIRRQDHIEWFQADYIFEADTQVSIKAASSIRIRNRPPTFCLPPLHAHSATKVFAEHGLCISQTFYRKIRRKASSLPPSISPECLQYLPHLGHFMYERVTSCLTPPAPRRTIPPCGPPRQNIQTHGAGHDKPANQLPQPECI